MGSASRYRPWYLLAPAALASVRHSLIKGHRRLRCSLREQRQRGAQYALLLCTVTRCPHRCASLQAGKRCPRWIGKTGSSAIPTRQRGSNTGLFQSSCNQSHGLRTNRSGRNQYCCVRIHVSNGCAHGWDGFIKYTSHIGLITHEADDVRRKRSDFTRINHTVQMFDR